MIKMAKNNKPTHAWGIASLVLGILSLFLFLAPYIGIFLAITAVVFYGIQKKHESTGVATGGLVTGIIGIIINGIMLLFVIGLLAMFGGLSSIDSGDSLSDHPSIETSIRDSNDSVSDVDTIAPKEQDTVILNSIYSESDVDDIIAEAKGIANKQEQKLAFWKKYTIYEGDSYLVAFTPYANTVGTIAGMIEKYDEYDKDTVKTYLNLDNIYTTAFNIETTEMFTSWDTSDIRAVIEYGDGKICRGKIDNVDSEMGEWDGSDWNYLTSISATFNCYSEVHNKNAKFVYIAGNTKVYFDVPLKDMK
jgi:hypothetical protein